MKTNKLVKILSLPLSLILIFALFAACSSKKDGSAIKVGVCAGPYEDMFQEAIEPALKEKGYTVEYV